MAVLKMVEYGQHELLHEPTFTKNRNPWLFNLGI